MRVVAVTVIVVALIVGMAGPFAVAHLTGKQRLAEKREDWRRQDEVAARLLAANAKTDVKLDTIHTLVNSNLTAAMQSELNALTALVVNLRAASGEGDPVKDKAEIAHLEERIVELTAQLADRHQAQDIVEQAQPADPI
jgi:hypothetical protein